MSGCFRGIGWLVVLACVLNGSAGLAGEFALKPGKELKVLHDGGELLAADMITPYGDGWEAGILDVRTVGEATVANTWHKDGKDVQYRREVGVWPDRVELTCTYRLYPYRNVPEAPNIAYQFRVPWARLKNCSWKALRGFASSPPKALEGKLGDTQPDGTILSQVRYIAFKGPHTRLVFDLNPKGLFSKQDFECGGFLGAWQLVKRGEYVDFAFGYDAKFFGCTVAGKALIYEGDYAFDSVHPMAKYVNFGALPFERRYGAGAAELPEGWVRLAAANTADVAWERTDTIAETRGPGKGTLANALVGRGRNTLTVTVPPAVYMVTLRAGGAAAGPFDVKLDGEVKARGVRVTPDKPARLPLSAYCRDGKMRVEFLTQDSWALSTLTLQPLLSAYEDFGFDRGAWLVDGIFTPEG